MDIKGIIIAVFLGWCGGYRFYRNQYLLGIVYFFTGGIFGIGWIIDIVSSIKYGKNSLPQNNVVELNELKRIRTKVVGVTFPCIRETDLSRQEILKEMPLWFIKSLRKDYLRVEYSEYNGEPAYLVLRNGDNIDIGYLKKELAAKLAKQYRDCIIKVEDWEINGGDDGLNYGCNIELVIYKGKV